MNNSLHIIGIAGKKHSGKDTIHKIIHNALFKNFYVEHKPFAAALKVEVAEAAGVSLEYMDEHKESFRLILQGWGTEFRRKLCAEDYWIVKWKAGVHYIKNNLTTPTIIVVPDVRFLNEANAIKEEGGSLWSVELLNGPSRNDDAHESETQLDYYQDFDWLVKNEYGKPKELIDKVKEQLTRMKLNT